MDIETVRKQLKNYFIHYGCSEGEATAIMQSLLLAEMCGEYSHGLKMVKSHVGRILRNGYKLNDHVEIEKETASFARVNCKNMIGMYTAKVCMSLAISKAKDNGLFVVFANHCNTYSAAFVYSMQAANEGLIGITMCNTPAQMAPYGGSTRLIGTNPISFAFPANLYDNIVFDMATSKVAKSKIGLYRDVKKQIPLGWAYDKDGKPTIDPNVAMTGLLAPFADGPKGIGIAMMIDLLAGTLTGASFLDGVGFFNDDNMNVGQVFIAIDPKYVYGDNYIELIDKYIERIKSVPSVLPDIKECQLPGENKYRMLRRCLEKNQIEIDAGLYREISSLRSE